HGALRDGGRLEQGRKGQIDLERLPDLVEKPDRDERLTSELEEVVVNAHFRDAEELAPHGRELAFDVVAGLDVARAELRTRETDAFALFVGRAFARRSRIGIDLRDPVDDVDRRGDDRSADWCGEDAGECVHALLGPDSMLDDRAEAGWGRGP